MVVAENHHTEKLLVTDKQIPLLLNCYLGNNKKKELSKSYLELLLDVVCKVPAGGSSSRFFQEPDPSHSCGLDLPSFKAEQLGALRSPADPVHSYQASLFMVLDSFAHHQAREKVRKY